MYINSYRCIFEINVFKVKRQIIEGGEYKRKKREKGERENRKYLVIV